MKKTKNELNVELLILPDGRVLVQNLTQPMAALLHKLNPKDKTIALRTRKVSKQAV
jgi:hypothetical protein